MGFYTAAGFNSVVAKLKSLLGCAHVRCVIYGAVLAPGVREISRSILAVCELVPPI